MAKRLGWDLGRFRYRVNFYKQHTVIDDYGSHEDTWSLSLSTRGDKIIKNRTFQSQSNAGEFDFYQVYNFVIRDRNRFQVEKDMIIYCDNVLYVIHGFAPLDNNPEYIQIFTSTVNDSHHPIWDIINAMPIEDDKPNIIEWGT